MSIKSFKIPQGKPGFVFSIQCQEHRQKVLQVVWNSARDGSHSQLYFG